MKVAITGATGLIGNALSQHLRQRGVQVVVATRHPARVEAASRDTGVIAVGWDPDAGVMSADALGHVDAVVNLAGAPLARRWSRRAKEEIRESRIRSTRTIVKALGQIEPRPKVLISASAVGYYGDRADDELTEASSAGAGFLPEVCRQWEAEAERGTDLGVSVVKARFGVVLAPGGGALSAMRWPFLLGIGGRLGAGTQWVPWVHIDDVVGAIQFAIDTPTLEGVINVTAPGVVRNAAFAKAFASALGRPAAIPMPEFLLRRVLGDLADEMLLSSQRVVPRKLQEAGYRFRQPDLQGALENALRTEPRRVEGLSHA